MQNTVEFPVTVSGSNALHLGAKATFALAFQASFSRQWQVQSTETTKAAFSVSPGDAIQLGVVNATSRTTGELKMPGQRTRPPRVTRLSASGPGCYPMTSARLMMASPHRA
ncbi:hypothetical protein ACIRS1_25070 [Kitasatospora sp. NPDC101176]|uniref:hypothetical protein n=1 Tax=Kitasatospora sp. NPDC101176 TaxID=3364099 RepID=UPI0037FA68C3